MLYLSSTIKVRLPFKQKSFILAKILIKSRSLSPRLAYVCDFVFYETLGWPWEYAAASSDSEVSVAHEGVSISFVHHGVLFENGIKNQTHQQYRDLIHNLDLSAPIETIDVFGIIFYLLSRYEEYCEDARDQHDRFVAQASCLFRGGFLEVPVVDHFLHRLKLHLSQRFDKKAKPAERRFISTIDIDFPWYRQHLKFPYTLRKKRFASDPYDTYDDILEWHADLNTPIFFWLSAGSRPYDAMQRYKKHAVKEQFLRLETQGATLGIHPNYQSGFDQKSMQKSIAYFEKIANRKPTLSRQHYLRLKLPLTYRLLIQENIQADYSMGFAECIGYRAGTAHDFYWYDITHETATQLRLYPLTAMDVTMKNYMNLPPETALIKMQKLWENMELLGGNFILLWHNSSLSTIDDWQDYRNMYIEFLSTIKN